MFYFCYNKWEKKLWLTFPTVCRLMSEHNGCCLFCFENGRKIFVLIAFIIIGSSFLPVVFKLINCTSSTIGFRQMLIDPIIMKFFEMFKCEHYCSLLVFYCLTIISLVMCNYWLIFPSVSHVPVAHNIIWIIFRVTIGFSCDLLAFFYEGIYFGVLTNNWSIKCI